MPLNMPTIMQQEFEKRLRATGRENVEELMAFMSSNGFYSAHCHNHHHFEGGTAQHSMEMLLYSLEHNRFHIPEDKLVIVCLLHDMCDIPGWEQYAYNEKQRRIHGARSVKLITLAAHFQLDTDEYLAILHHMHSATRHPERFGNDFDIVTSSPLWQLLRESDRYSAGRVMSRYQLADKIQNI